MRFPGSWLRASVANGALFCISLVLALFVSELILRIFVPQELTAVVNIYEEDSSLKYAHGPNLSARHRMKDFDVEMRTNSIGFRDREYSASKPAGVCRILVTGDSFSVGVGVSEEASYPHVLESSLNGGEGESIGNRWEVINAAVSGYHLRQYVTSIERYGVKFDVDAVLLGFFIGNDFGAGPRPNARMIVEDGYLLGYDKHENVSDESVRVQIRRAYRSFRRFLVTNSHLAVLVRNNSYPLLYKLKLLDAPYKSNLDYYAVDGVHGLQLYEDTKDLLEEISTYSAKTGISIIVLLIPQRFQVYTDLWHHVVAEVGVPPNDFSFDIPNRRLTAEFDRLGFGYVDIMNVMRAAQAEEFYFEHDSHWNELGHQVSGKALADAFLALEDSICEMSRPAD